MGFGRGFFVWFLGIRVLAGFFLSTETNYKIPLGMKSCLAWQGKPRRPTILIWIRIQTITVSRGRTDYRYKLF